MPVVVRAAAAEDRTAVLALVARVGTASITDSAVDYFLRLAFERASNEARVIVAEQDGAVAGFVLYGEVAGSVGTARLHRVLVAPSAQGESIGVRLCASAIADVMTRNCRLVVAERPSDPSSAHDRSVLDQCGLAECARVRDYYRDGVDLVVLQRFLHVSGP